MSNEKLTRNEMAERNANALIRSGLSRVENPPTGIGAKHCIECGDEIPIGRREAYGNGYCIYCTEL